MNENPLAVEAVNRIRTELINAPPITALEFRPTYAYFQKRVHIRMHRLAGIIDWEGRYRVALDSSLKRFLELNPLCVDQFQVTPDRHVPQLLYVCNKRVNENIEVPLPTGLRRYESENLAAPMVARERDEEAAPNNEALVSQALRTIRETLLTEIPHHRMNLALLNTRTRWAVTFGLSFGSMKQWIKYLRDTNRVTDIDIDESGGVGRDVVFLTTQDAATGGARPAPPGLVVPATPVEQPVVPAAPVLAAPVYFPPLLTENEAGVRTSDFFFLPLPSDCIEKSYFRTMARMTELLRRWTSAGFLQDCWQYQSDDFNKFKWLGSSIIRSEVTKTLLKNFSNLLDARGLDGRRQYVQQPFTLSLLFNELQLASFMQRCPSSWVTKLWTPKSKVLQAVVGELSFRMEDSSEFAIVLTRADRVDMRRFVLTICEAAVDRGAKLKSPESRQQIIDDATRPGGGGYLMEDLDRRALALQEPDEKEIESLQEEAPPQEGEEDLDDVEQQPHFSDDSEEEEEEQEDEYDFAENSPVVHATFVEPHPPLPAFDVQPAAMPFTLPPLPTYNVLP